MFEKMSSKNNNFNNESGNNTYPDLTGVVDESIIPPEFSLDEEKSMKSNGDRNKKLPNYSPDEDVWICCAFVSTSEDSIKGANQTSDTFWLSVKEKFECI